MVKKPPPPPPLPILHSLLSQQAEEKTPGREKETHRVDELRTGLLIFLVYDFLALKPTEVTEALQLSKLKDKVWYVVPSCATTGEGLLEGLAWLSNNVKAPPAPAKK